VEKWVPEIRHYLPLVPIVLVGTHKEESDAFLQCVKGLKGMKRKEPASMYAVHADQMQAQFRAVGHIQLLPRSLLSIRVNQGKIPMEHFIFCLKSPILPTPHFKTHAIAMHSTYLSQLRSKYRAYTPPRRYCQCQLFIDTVSQRGKYVIPEKLP
jgi:hypothetical protein